MPRSDTARLPVAAMCGGSAEGETRVEFTAHQLGQGGARRGLRGGESVLRGARVAYLSTQWRGPDDRRPTAGLLKRLSA